MIAVDPTLVRDIFNDAAMMPPGERERFLDRACAGNAELRARIALLLQAHRDAGGFLDLADNLPAVTDRADGPDAADSSHTDGQQELIRCAAEQVAGIQETAGALRPREGPGTLIGAYKLLERIGEGGFGTVYMAEQDQPIHRRVALKIIKLGMDTRQVVARFEAERQALAMMDHTHIARVLDAGATDGGRPYFVMDLVRGTPITAFCDEHRLTIRQRLDMFVQVCHAVQHAHIKGVIHRDLKPSNILAVRHDGTPVAKVIDFGIAKATGGRLTDKTLFTEFRQLIGTPAYMSPEQAGMSDIDIDTRSDIYSLGVLLYELLTGTTPFDAKSLLSSGYDEMRRIIREVEPPRPSKRVQEGTKAASRHTDRADDSAAAALPTDSGLRTQDSGLSWDSVLTIARYRHTDPAALSRMLRGDLDWIVMKCLDKDRTRRYETANGLAVDVERYLKNEPVLAGPPSRFYRFRKFVRRNRATATAATLVIASLLAGIAGTTFGLVRAEERRAEAEAARHQTQQVSEFQAAMLSGIDADAMGRGIKERFREQVRAALERQYVGDGADRRKRTLEEIEAEMAAFDQRANTAPAVDVARRVMDEFVLGRAAEALETQFADQPLVRAQLHAAIGSTYTNLGAYDGVEPHLRAALEIRRRELGDEHESVADSLSELGVLLLEKCDFAAGEPLLREALTTRRKLLGDEHTAVATSLHNLAGLLAAKGDRAAAEPLYYEALALRRKLRGNEHADVVWTLENLGNLLTDMGDFGAAEPLLREALAGARKLWGDQHPDTANCLSALARLLDYQGDYAAEPMYRKALSVAREAYGDEHPYVAAALFNLASAMTTQSNYRAAEPLFREALAIRRTVFGDEHPAVKNDLSALATALERQDKYAAAEPFRRELVERARKNSANNVNLAAALSRLGLNLVRQRSFAEAELLLRECAGLRGTLFPDGHLEAWLKYVASSALGEALSGQGAAMVESDAPAAIAKFIEAEPLLVESAEWLTENADRIPQEYRAVCLREALERIILLYESWDTVAPDSGKANQAAAWRAELEKPAGP